MKYLSYREINNIKVSFLSLPPKKRLLVHASMVYNFLETMKCGSYCGIYGKCDPVWCPIFSCLENSTHTIKKTLERLRIEINGYQLELFEDL